MCCEKVMYELGVWGNTYNSMSSSVDNKKGGTTSAKRLSHPQSD